MGDGRIEEVDRGEDADELWDAEAEYHEAFLLF